MQNPSRFWADWTTTDFQALATDRAMDRVIAVLPVAATEQHGPHLPLSVDTDLVNGVVAACLPHLPADLPALFLPTQTVGLSPEHARFAGTLTLKAETVIRLWTDIGESVAASGVKKLVLLNAHGGQVSVMDIVARELRARCEMIVVRANWYDLPLGAETEGLFSDHEHRFGIHAGEIETSMMLALQPQRVDMSRARDFRSTSRDRAERFPILGNGRSAKWGWQMQDYHPAGAAGNAAAADAARGRQLIEVAGRQLALLLAEVAQLPLSTLVDRPDLGA